MAPATASTLPGARVCSSFLRVFISSWGGSLLLIVVQLAITTEATQKSSPLNILQDTNDIQVKVLGDPIRVWGSIDAWKKCQIGDFPDIPTRAFAVPQHSKSSSSNNSSSDYIIHMIQGSTNAHIMTGPSLFDVTRACNMTWNMTGNADPAMFAGDEFLDSTVVFLNGTVISLSHTEYPGNRFDNCPGPSYPYCWTVTTGLMISHDFGMTWKHAQPPPHHLVAAVPYIYNTTQLASGWGDPTNILKHPSDGYYYVAMWNRNQVGLQKPGVCMMRSNALLEPSSWRGWNGTDYSVPFVSPYQTKDPAWNPANHICKVLPVDETILDPTKYSPFGLVWSPSLQVFLMTWACLSGYGSFYMTTSPDLIHWSTPQAIYDKSMLPNATRAHVTSMHYPNLMDVAAPTVLKDPNYSAITSTPHLFWVSFGHSPYSDGRTVWATPLGIASANRNHTPEGSAIQSQS